MFFFLFLFFACGVMELSSELGLGTILLSRSLWKELYSDIWALRYCGIKNWENKSYLRILLK